MAKKWTSAGSRLSRCAGVAHRRINRSAMELIRRSASWRLRPQLKPKARQEFSIQDFCEESIQAPRSVFNYLSALFLVITKAPIRPASRGNRQIYKLGLQMLMVMIARVP